MNIKALITTLAILGSSSVAMARPATVSVSAQAQASWSFGTTSPTIRDHRTPVRPAPVRPVITPVRQPATWYSQSYDWNRYNDRNNDRYDRFVTLESDLQFGDTDYRKDIVLGGTSGRFNTLRLDADNGRTYIMKVVVEFSDATFQQIDLNRTLRAGESLSLDLSGSNRLIHRILVYRADGAPALNMNTPHYGEFSVSAL